MKILIDVATVGAGWLQTDHSRVAWISSGTWAVIAAQVSRLVASSHAWHAIQTIQTAIVGQGTVVSTVETVVSTAWLQIVEATVATVAIIESVVSQLRSQLRSQSGSIATNTAQTITKAAQTIQATNANVVQGILIAQRCWWISQTTIVSVQSTES